MHFKKCRKVWQGDVKRRQVKTHFITENLKLYPEIDDHPKKVLSQRARRSKKFEISSEIENCERE